VFNPQSKSVNKDFFKTWSPEMAYVLGYWFADGNIYNNTFTIVSVDYDIIKKITDVMKSTYKIQKVNQTSMINGVIPKRKPLYRIAITNKFIVNSIKCLGGVEKKSLIAEFPDVPEKYLNHFIRGFLDGDGGISVRNHGNPEVVFYGTKSFLTTLNDRIKWKGKIIPQRKIYFLKFIAEDAQEVLKYMYTNSNIYLDRKYDIYKKAMLWKRKNFLWTKEEIDILKSIKNGRVVNVLSLLPNRRKSSVYQKYGDLVCKSEIYVKGG
ncbi:MAG: hypothetical protein IMZ52_04815, partial [Actinobacteria bacterium]|nr:hypothetical protein [Actinomycetota bacterium]